MILASHFDILAAGSGPTEFSFDGGAEQWWTDVLASALTGLALLPFALVFVWALHRTSLNRWLIVTGASATVFALIASSLVAEFIAPIWLYLDQALQIIGVNRFMIYFMPSLLVCFIGAMILAWWLRRDRTSRAEEVFE
ncbi:hypothetical protein AAG596_02745 [Citromicrobium bathyomarinum]|uniref:hypothetical protein n=1 Tax=Citromicrobium bathyomarinum TaxID=72174 RepID=UPI00315ADEA2